MWESSLQDGSSTGVFARRFDSLGVPQASEFQVNTYATNAQSYPDVDLADDGDFVVVWQSQLGASSYGVFGRRFAAGGEPQAFEFQVNSRTTTHEPHPAVAVDGDGDFVVTWEDADGVSIGTFARRFDAAGLPQAAEFQV